MVSNMDEKVIKALTNRLKRAEGQIHALRSKLENKNDVRDCKLFVSQIKAARNALKMTSEQYVLEYIYQCQTLPEKKRKEHIAEVLKILASD